MYLQFCTPSPALLVLVTTFFYNKMYNMAYGKYSCQLVKLTISAIAKLFEVAEAVEPGSDDLANFYVY